VAKKKPSTKTVKIYVTSKAGMSLPGHGHRAYGESFTVAADIGETLTRASPSLSFDAPPQETVPDEPTQEV